MFILHMLEKKTEKHLSKKEYNKYILIDVIFYR